MTPIRLRLLIGVISVVLLAACGGTESRMADTKLLPAPAEVGKLVVSGLSKEYVIAKTSEAYTITQKSSGAVVTAPLATELISFSDLSVSLTIENKARSIPAADMKLLIELYVAFFNRIPDAEGLAYWIEQNKHGMSISQIAESFYSAAVQYSNLTGYTGTMSNMDFVKIIYKNVLGRSGDTAPSMQDVQYWIGELESARATKGTLIITMLNAAHSFAGDATWGWVPQLLDNKYSVSTKFAVNYGYSYLTPEDSIRKTSAIAEAVTPTDTASAFHLFDPDAALPGVASSDAITASVDALVGFWHFTCDGQGKSQVVEIVKAADNKIHFKRAIVHDYTSANCSGKYSESVKDGSAGSDYTTFTTSYFNTDQSLYADGMSTDEKSGQPIKVSGLLSKDRNIWSLTNSGWQAINRIPTYAFPNFSLLASPNAGYTPLTVTFSSNLSNVPSTPFSITWDFENDGNIGYASGDTTASFVYKRIPQPISNLAPDPASGFAYDLTGNVPDADASLIKKSLTEGQTLLATQAGGGISEDLRSRITVKIVATGRGNEELGGGGSCCTALSAADATITVRATLTDNVQRQTSATTNVTVRGSIIRPFFDVAHEQWARSASPTNLWSLNDDHRKTVMHEYTHAWQSYLGCLSEFDQPLGGWLNEGIAEYVGAEGMLKNTNLQRADVHGFQLSSARFTGELARPLRDFATQNYPVWPGHVGYLAIERLLQNAPEDLSPLRKLCTAVAGGSTVSAAFFTAFGVAQDSFYQQFEQQRLLWLTN